MFATGATALFHIAGRAYAGILPLHVVSRQRIERRQDGLLEATYGRVCRVERGRVDMGASAGVGRRDEGLLCTRLAITAWLE